MLQANVFINSSICFKEQISSLFEFKIFSKSSFISTNVIIHSIHNCYCAVIFYDISSSSFFLMFTPICVFIHGNHLYIVIMFPISLCFTPLSKLCSLPLVRFIFCSHPGHPNGPSPSVWIYLWVEWQCSEQLLVCQDIILQLED